ncbi:MAG: polysaccharide export protein [Acidobacteria bacterium]|nr:polysaccharide export protein [Acidobacteriota bacterium]
MNLYFAGKVLNLASRELKPLFRSSVIFALIGWMILFSCLALPGKAQRLPAPSNSSATQDAPKDYRIHKGDKLSIKFLYQPELSDAAVVVRPDGKISLPMIDEIQVDGLTAKELKTVLEKAYREILLDPEITVNVVEFVTPRVFVGGQVAKPGSYELRAAQTLLQAVILAGGFTPEAHRKYVLHARSVGNHELKVVAVDVTKVLKTGDGKQEILLQDGDYIFIPNSKLSKFSAIVNAFRVIVPGYGIQF